MPTDAKAPKAVRRPWIRRLRRIGVGALVALLVALVVYGLIPGRTPAENPSYNPSGHAVVAVFGATGTVGDGVLEALVADTDVGIIHVVTRRTTPRIEQAVASGRAVVHMHDDYGDYGGIAEILPQLDAVYWALGTSAVNVDDAQYTVIHVDFPVAFVAAWLPAAPDRPRSFHLVTGQGTSADGWQHWARAKAAAERALVAAAEGSTMRVVAYRPTYVVPSASRSTWLQGAAHTMLSPFDLATRSTDIGRAMLEVTARGPDELPNATILENKDLLQYAAAYEAR